MSNSPSNRLGLALMLAASCSAGLACGAAFGQATADSKPAATKKVVPNPALDHYNKVVTDFNKATQDFNSAKNSNNADASEDGGPGDRLEHQGPGGPGTDAGLSERRHGP